MDVARELLNNLMGRDRNKPKGDTSGRDHYSNRDVCKPYLICFCFNTLFPNTVYDQGPCNKRHDTYLKNMFDNDLNRKDYEREYIKQCINWIQKRLTDVDQKIKKNLSVIETKTTFTGDKPKEVLNRIIAIDADIQNMMKQAQIFGQNGQIDESARCLEEAERLRQRRRQIESMNDATNAVQKQQKICDICGAIQTINDTQKRIQTHLQGKIHQGFLKLRHELQTLKVRLQIINQMDPNKKDKENQKQVTKEKEKERQRERERQRQREREKQRQRQRERQRQKERQREKQREKQRQKNRQSQKYGDDIQKKKSFQMQDERDRRSHSHKKKKEKDRDRSRDKQKKSKKQKEDKHRDRDRDYDADRDKKQKKKHKKDRSKSRSRDKYPQRDRDRENRREHER